MPIYIHEREDWPRFRWDNGALAKALAGVRERQESLLGRMQARGPAARREAVLETLTQEILKSSELGGAVLVPALVRTSLARRVVDTPAGPTTPAHPLTDRAVEGIVDITLDATQRYHRPLTAERLLSWHAALFPAGYIGIHPQVVGAWRDDRASSRRVISGPADRQRVHFEAPPARRIEPEIKRFLGWFNAAHAFDPVLKAGLAHLWFLTIRPFDEGNGRIARAILATALARADASPERFYGLSGQIRREQITYGDVLEAAQKGELDVTPWLRWFLGCLDRALTGAEEILATVLAKARLWEQHIYAALNERQRDMLNRLIDGFEGKLTPSRWATIERCSPDTALHDIDDLVARGILRKEETGVRHGMSYSLAEFRR